MQLKVRFASFRTITRSRTLDSPTDLAGAIAPVARELLRAVPIGDGIRLLGVSMHQLAPATSLPQRLFDDAGGGTSRQEGIERSLDAVRARFGPGAVGSGPGAVGPGLAR